MLKVAASYKYLLIFCFYCPRSPTPVPKMLTKVLSKAATIAVLASVSICSTFEERQSNLNEFILAERGIALTGALANIGGLNSSLVPGADPGVVVASPSTVNPNYFYTWTRDSALTYLMIIDELLLGNTSLRKTVEDYVTAQAYLQTITNPSGSLYPAGDGLGEPKFYTNLTRFDVSPSSNSRRTT
jgi:glucoamylase